MKPNSPRLRLTILASFAIVLLAIVMLAIRSTHDRRKSPALPVAAKESVTPEIDPWVPDKVLLRPLPVVRKSAKHEWSSDDAKDPGVIQRIAHNAEETKRLTEENARIKRRQLVYRKETVPALIQRLGGHPLTEFTLPGLDGREIEVEVVETRLNGLHAGSVMGRVKGVMNSMVSVGFFNGCESFNISLPDEDLFLTADAREPGEALVKEIDPEVYLPPTKCEPIVIE